MRENSCADSLQLTTASLGTRKLQYRLPQLQFHLHLGRSMKQNRQKRVHKLRLLIRVDGQDAMRLRQNRNAKSGTRR